MAKILLTGGGTAGHVTANLALLSELRDKHTIYYMGSKDGIEKELAEKAGLPYFGISTGKLRRYFSLRNLTDPFRVIGGFFQARKQIKAWNIDLVFSKGGFVAVPVIFAAASLGIPIICHESDFTPGLANKLTIPFTKKICCNFPETVSLLPKGKSGIRGNQYCRSGEFNKIGRKLRYHPYLWKEERGQLSLRFGVLQAVSLCE